MRIFNLEEPLIYSYFRSGFYSFISRDMVLLQKITDRSGVCLKVFFNPLIGDIKDYNWGHPFLVASNNMAPRSERARLIDAVIIQNLCAWHGLAPRVYEIVGLSWEGKIYPALIVDDLGEASDMVEWDQRVKIMEAIKKIGDKYGFYTEYEDLGQARNFIKDKFVDFQAFKLKPDYRDQVIKRYKAKAKWSENTYQTVPELGIGGYRDNERRLELMQLNKLDFTGKSVLDIGCSGGFYCRYAKDRGASRVLGVDLQNVADAAFEVSNYLGYYDINYSGMKLEPNLDYNFGFSIDIIFYLSVYRYFGYAPFLKKAKMIIYEHNGDVPEEEAIKQFSKDFPKHWEVAITGRDTGSNDDRRTLIFAKE
jgi:hypothetical protein